MTPTKPGDGRNLTTLSLVLIWAAQSFITTITAAPVSVRFSTPASTVQVHDFIEVTVTVAEPDARNPFIDATVAGEFSSETGPPVAVEGFCDSSDGSVYRVRFMPSEPGVYRYSVRFQQGAFERSHAGTFQAEHARRRGQLRVDPAYPEHFVWSGTGEHYFWNGTTTYYLMGWEDEEVIRRTIDRLASFKVNRLRVLVYGRNEDRPWNQPVKSTPAFKLYLNPWPAARPDDVKNPGFDLARFNVPFWQKYERMLRHARERDVIVSVIFFIGGQVFPTPFAAYSEDEKRFYRYGVARLAAFSNITWDLGNEHNFHREAPKWCDWLGPLVKAWDPYDHLNSAHNVIYRTPGAVWNDLQLIQRWDAGQNAYMLSERANQAAAGRVIPQINEEYGYEDLWEKYPGERSAETRRRLAWEISMAGCYQTTGETANRGVGFQPDAGGGWVSGRGDDSMTMLRGYNHMVTFFSNFDWWRGIPTNALVSGGAFCLAEPGRVYAVYSTSSASILSLKLTEGRYRVRRFDPRSGEWTSLPSAGGPVWSASTPAGGSDWAYLLQRDDGQIDAAPPALLAAHASGRANQLIVTFSEALDPATANDAANYRLTPNGAVLDAELHPQEPNKVTLRTAELNAGTTRTLAVSAVADRSPRRNVIRNQAKVSFEVHDASLPLVELLFDRVTERTTPNTGSASKTGSKAMLTDRQPKTTSQTPSGSGTAIDFGREPGEFAVELGSQTIEVLSGLRSFTISGWLNCRDATVGSGGNRIVSTINSGGDGFDLVLLKDGRLQLSVNQWPDGLATHSSVGKISADPETARDNWRFFAVSYDSTAESEQVKFCFGGLDKDVTRDTAVTYNRGPVGQGVGTLAIGHFNRTTRSGHADRMFRGILDEIRIHGSKVDDAGALPLNDIRAIHRRN